MTSIKNVIFRPFHFHCPSKNYILSKVSQVSDEINEFETQILNYVHGFLGAPFDTLGYTLAVLNTIAGSSIPGYTREMCSWVNPHSSLTNAIRNSCSEFVWIQSCVFPKLWKEVEDSQNLQSVYFVPWLWLQCMEMLKPHKKLVSH